MSFDSFDLARVHQQKLDSPPFHAMDTTSGSTKEVFMGLWTGELRSAAATMLQGVLQSFLQTTMPGSWFHFVSS